MKEQTPLDWHYEEDDERLIPTIKSLKQHTPAYDAIFIDTAGFKSAMAIYAINAASLVLIPSKANEADAKGAMRTHSHVQSVAASMDKQIGSYVVMMDVDANTNITQSVTEALDAQEVPRLHAMCGHRTGFKEMTSTGLLPSGPARREAQTIIAELQQRALLDYYRGQKWLKSA